jgi:hypothetical protein
MPKKLIMSVAISLLFLSSANAQDKSCPDIPGQTSATHRFHHEGETIEIALRTDSPDCEPVSIGLHWANGRNNGSNFNVTFLDGGNRPIYARQVSAFMTGVLEFPLSSFEPQPVYGSSVEVISVPTTVRIQAVSPFAGSAILAYSIARVARKNGATGEQGNWVNLETKTNENEIAGIHDVVRLIGATRLPLVQVELKTTRPFPVRNIPLQLQIGKRVFVDELSGDYTGRKLTLSLTPEMFAELSEGDEIVAFYGKPSATATSSEPASAGSAEGDVWHFGKLRKSMKQTQ